MGISGRVEGRLWDGGVGDAVDWDVGRVVELG